MPLGKIIGMCSGTFTRPDTAFMGFYAVEPDYQGLGVGRKLWSTTLERLDSRTNVGLYGVPSMSHKYKKAGFILEDSIRMIIYESKPGETLKLDTSQLKDIDELLGCRLQLIDSNIEDSMLKKLIEYDQSVQKFSRERLLKLLVSSENVPLIYAIVKDHSTSKICVQQDQHGSQTHPVERKSSCCARPNQESIIEDETLSTSIRGSLSISATNLGDIPLRCSSPIDIPSVSATTYENPNGDPCFVVPYEILGYGCIKPDNTSGAMVGPIYADSSDICEVILKNLLEDFKLKPGGKISIMALSSNKQAYKICNKIGMIEIDQCTRLFTKFIPTASFSKIYYVHTPNFSLF